MTCILILWYYEYNPIINLNTNPEEVVEVNRDYDSSNMNGAPYNILLSNIGEYRLTIIDADIDGAGINDEENDGIKEMRITVQTSTGEQKEIIIRYTD